MIKTGHALENISGVESHSIWWDDVDITMPVRWTSNRNHKTYHTVPAMTTADISPPDSGFSPYLLLEIDRIIIHRQQSHTNQVTPADFQKAESPREQLIAFIIRCMKFRVKGLRNPGVHKDLASESHSAWKAALPMRKSMEEEIPTGR
jgi:hypothetical protein